MKKILFITAVFIIITIYFMAQQMALTKDDPYSFLNPKATEDNPIEIPIKLYEKGEKINLVFWNVPVPRPKILYIIPANTPVPQIELKIKRAIKEKVNKKLTYYTGSLFDVDGPLNKPKDSPILLIKLYKINDDLSERLLLEEVYNKPYGISGGADGISFGFISLGHRYKYGQYRVQVEILGDWPMLKTDDIDYYLTIFLFAIK